MAVRFKLVLLAVSILVIGFGVVDTQAARHRHSHKLVVKEYFNDVLQPPGNDPATFGVVGVGVRCPSGYRATGGGYSADKISLVPHADLNPTSYDAIAINQTDESGGKLTVTVACIAGKTKASKAQAGGRSLKRLVAAYRADLARR